MAKKSNRKHCWPNKFVWQENPYPHLKADADFFQPPQISQIQSKINYIIVFYLFRCCRLEGNPPRSVSLIFEFRATFKSSFQKIASALCFRMTAFAEWRRSVSVIRINSYGIETAIRCFSLLYNFKAKMIFFEQACRKAGKNVRAASAADGIKNDVWRMVGLVKTA